MRRLDRPISSVIGAPTKGDGLLTEGCVRMDTRYDYGGDEFIFVDFDIEMSLEVNTDRHQDPSVSNLEYLMATNGYSSKDEFIAVHSGTPYWVSMIGFVPGTAWGFQMVSRDRAIQAPKYVRPRTDTPERAVSHGGVFMAIYPVRGPGGYQLLGMTPVPIYDPTGSLVDLRERYILALAGDR